MDIHDLISDVDNGVPPRLFVQCAESQGLRAGTMPSVYEVMIDKSVHEWLKDTVRQSLQPLDDKEVVDFYETDEASELTVRRLALAEDAEALQMVRHVQENQCPRFDPEKFPAKPRALIAALAGGELYAVRTITESALITERRIVLRLKPNTGEYSLEEPGLHMILDDKWDAFIKGTNMWLINENQVLRLFRYYEHFARAASNYIQTLAQHPLIGDLEDFGAFVNSRVSIQKRLARLDSNSLGNVDWEKLKLLIDEKRVGLSLDAEGRLTCTSTAEARILVDVLLDNYVESVLTPTQYRALNKRPWQ